MCAKRARDDTAQPPRQSVPVVDWLRRDALNVLNPHNGWIANDVLDMVHARVREPTLHTLRSIPHCYPVCHSYSLHTGRWSPGVTMTSARLYRRQATMGCVAYRDGWCGRGFRQSMYMSRSGDRTFSWLDGIDDAMWSTVARDLPHSAPLISFHLKDDQSVIMETLHINTTRLVSRNSCNIFRLPIDELYGCDACGLGAEKVVMRATTRITHQSIPLLIDVHAMHGTEIEVSDIVQFDAIDILAQLVQVEEANVIEIWDAARQLHARYDTREGNWRSCAGGPVTTLAKPDFVRIDSQCIASLGYHHHTQMRVWFYDRRACAWQAGPRLQESSGPVPLAVPISYLSSFLRCTEPCT